ncbi:ABC transporter ATP-binding protein [Reyranella sp. CPCC 100927]|uniref:ABC transporter ATP-binding protein n=1 Tax=Reyranella sp. CPCC 100927 TaxID=2599616 RepID=UPI0011B799AC|nr:ABC transporter ATP-binding protein [Reyranella sp. CPCC 100927]TWS99684.1 ABC transporter ATP-binding protein [Reyranella sp. CPCC 100927]
MTEPVIAIRGLRKNYGRAAAVDGIDLDIHRGEIFGLLGPNGAGKTTTILMVLGLTESNGGTVRVLGEDPIRNPLAVKRRVGYLPDAVGFYDNLSARENLLYTLRLAGFSHAEAVTRIENAMARVRLSDVLTHKVRTFSRGMRQRLGIAEIIAKGAEIAILDEPTSGLDPHATLELLDMIRDLKADGVAVLLSSHLLDRVQSICDRVALFNRGLIAMQGTVKALGEQVLGASHAAHVEADGVDVAARLQDIAGVRKVEADGRGWKLTADRDVMADVAQAIVQGGGRLQRLATAEPSLEAIYTRYFEEHKDAA